MYWERYLPVALPNKCSVSMFSRIFPLKFDTSITWGVRSALPACFCALLSHTSSKQLRMVDVSEGAALISHTGSTPILER